jgi:hypothetical protein
MNNKPELLTFLKDLTFLAENDTLTTGQMLHISEFYVSYKYKEENGFDEFDKHKEEFTEEEIMKFMFLGWFIYCIILENKKLEKIKN